ncbi:MAG: hypothetical protein M1812_005608 [Candelaria pacifica]|nr:MAG: hypothetical protein M1812_005608 [Candelaria pacifica]
MRFLAFAALLTGVLATEMDSYGSQGNSGSGAAMGKTGADKAGADKAGGDKAGGDKAGSGKIDITIGVTVISSHAGGSTEKKQLATPPMAAGMTHQVTVGGTAGLVYAPETIIAAVGDMVQFNFMSTNHTVTQSAFAKPCVKMDGGIDSNFLSNANNAVNPAPSFVFQVTAMTPVWFYCKQKTGTHCGKGMVFSINPTANKTHDQFKQMAMQQNGTAVLSSSGAQAAGAASTTTYSTVTIVATPMQSSMSTATLTTLAAAAAAVPSGGSSSGSASGSGSGAASGAASGSSSGSMVAGTGSNGADGSCSCSCLCGVAGFPANAGIGMYGGMSGKISTTVFDVPNVMAGTDMLVGSMPVS